MSLFEPYRLGSLELRNRVVMAPMTRGRAIEGNVPSPLAATYYAQRASAGLIVSEGSQVSPAGQGYVRTPGIHSPEQVAGWKRVTEAVHERGGRIFLQLWHVGRISHPDLIGGETPVAPSALDPGVEVFTPQGRKATVTPRALELSEIPGIVERFKRGAENAKAAGFDGVEIHGANGYLLDQFLRDGSNHRSDGYGGSARNRARLPLEVTEAVIGVFGRDRVGYRVSPSGSFNGISDSNPVETFGHLARELAALRIGYLHVYEGLSNGPGPGRPRVTPVLRELFPGTLIVNGGFDPGTAGAALAEGADLVAFGVPFLANPDLVERFRRNAPLNSPDRATFYQGEERGYVDYPAMVD